MSSATFHIEELDEKSRRYLREVRLAQGQGFPRVYASPPDWLLANWSYFLVICLFGALAIVTKELILTEPTALALLQTALFLLGLWFFFLPLRLWLFQNSPNRAGYFLFLDDKYLWHCKGAQVHVLAIDSIQEVDISPQEDNSKEWLVTLTTPQGISTFKLCRSEDAQAIEGHLDMFRVGLRTCANHEVPDPFRQGREKWEVKTLFTWLLVAVLGFLGWRTLNISLRDDAIWESISGIHPESAKIYWLRLYLRDPANTHHRAKAARALYNIYVDKLAVIQTIQMMDHPLPDPELFAGLEPILKEMGKSLDPAILKFSLKFSGNGDEVSKEWEKEGAQQYAETLFHSVGENFIIITGPIDPPAHIEITCDWITQGTGLGLKFVVQYRMDPEKEPFKTATWVEKVTGKNPEQAGLAAQALAHRTANYPDP